MYSAIEFLLIEGNPGDVRLTEECFKTYKIANRLNVVSDNQQALRFLRQQEEFSLANPPDVILTCISMLWESDYTNLMESIQSDERLKDIPIVVLTAFEGEEDSLHDRTTSSIYLPKPLNMNGIVHILQNLQNIEFAICKDPTIFLTTDD